MKKQKPITEMNADEIVTAFELAAQQQDIEMWPPLRREILRRLKEIDETGVRKRGLDCHD